MGECWLRTNRRALLLGCIFPFVAMAIGAALFSWRWPEWSGIVFVSRAVGGLMFIGSLGLLTALVLAMRKPRVAYADGNLLLHLRDGRPIEVPLDIVEVFFRGQGPSHVGQGVVEQAETSNIVIRLAERATDWHHVDVKPALGHWCEGYITLHGAWCEPIGREALEQLNSRLVLTKRKLKAEQAADQSQGQKDSQQELSA